jgi:hypothetical protein
LQAVLTAYWYYEDIKGVQGASGCAKSKVVKRKFEDQEDIKRAPDADAADAAAGAAAIPATPATPRTEARQPHPAGRSLHRPPALGARAGATRGGREGMVKRLPKPKADAD